MTESLWEREMVVPLRPLRKRGTVTAGRWTKSCPLPIGFLVFGKVLGSEKNKKKLKKTFKKVWLSG